MAKLSILSLWKIFALFWPADMVSFFFNPSIWPFRQISCVSLLAIRLPITWQCTAENGGRSCFSL